MKATIQKKSWTEITCYEVWFEDEDGKDRGGRIFSGRTPKSEMIDWATRLGAEGVTFKL